MNRSGAKLTIVSMLVILLAVLLAALLAYLTPEAAEPDDWEPQVAEGRLPGFEDTPVNNDGRYFFYQLCREVEFSKPTAPGGVLIENTPGNLYDMQVEYSLEDYGVIYLSPVLEPGQHIINDRLREELPEGEYDVQARVCVLDPDTGDNTENFYENITVIVKNKLF